jgi:ACR3 family arsenite efflux pump ArsB
MKGVADTVNLKPAPAGGLGTFERYLSVWVALCMVAGIGLGISCSGVKCTSMPSSCAKTGHQATK